MQRPTKFVMLMDGRTVYVTDPGYVLPGAASTGGGKFNWSLGSEVN